MSMEASKKYGLIAPLVTTAAILGIVQGLVWVLLSLGAIFLYEGVFLPTNTPNLGMIIYEAYLYKAPRVDGSPLIIGPKEFSYFTYIYLVFSFSLFVISLVILWAAIRGASEKFHKIRILLWTINVTILSLLDFILVCLIAHDYHQIKKLAETPDEIYSMTIDLVAVGVVMTIAARGFVIWIINSIFIVILGKHWYHLHKKGAQSDQSILDAYSTRSQPPWGLTNSFYEDINRPEHNNKGFRDDHDNPMIIAPSKSFTHLPVQERNNYENRERGNQKGLNPYSNFGGNNNNANNNNWNKRNQNDNGQSGRNNSPLRPTPDRAPDNQWGQPSPSRTAKIGRQGGQRSPPLNVNPPFIPDPDYSPPGSPRVRGVLRPKSNYDMY